MKLFVIECFLASKRGIAFRWASICCFVALVFCGQAGFADGGSASTFAPAGFDVAPTNFLRQITLADHIIVSNRIADADSPQFERFALDISGGEMDQVTKALSELKNHFEPNTSYPLASAICAWQLQFYRGTNCLTTANFQGRLIRCDGGEYSDSTGTLDALSVKISKREHYEQYYKDEEKDFKAARKAEAREWLKFSIHSVGKSGKERISQFVKEFYALGAAKVFLTDIKKEESKAASIAEKATTLVVVLPQDPNLREHIFSYAEKQAGTWTAEQDSDVGQKYLWLPFE